MPTAADFIKLRDAVLAKHQLDMTQRAHTTWLAFYLWHDPDSRYAHTNRMPWWAWLAPPKDTRLLSIRYHDLETLLHIPTCVVQSSINAYRRKCGARRYVPDASDDDSPRSEWHSRGSFSERDLRWEMDEIGSYPHITEDRGRIPYKTHVL